MGETGRAATITWNKPLLPGEIKCDAMLMEPADWPNTVTWSGLPPKAAMLAWTHCSDRLQAGRGSAATESPQPRKPFRATPVNQQRPPTSTQNNTDAQRGAWSESGGSGSVPLVQEAVVASDA